VYTGSPQGIPPQQLVQSPPSTPRPQTPLTTINDPGNHCHRTSSLPVTALMPSPTDSRHLVTQSRCSWASPARVCSRLRDTCLQWGASPHTHASLAGNSTLRTCVLGDSSHCVYNVYAFKCTCVHRQPRPSPSKTQPTTTMHSCAPPTYQGHLCPNPFKPLNCNLQSRCEHFPQKGPVTNTSVQYSCSSVGERGRHINNRRRRLGCLETGTTLGQQATLGITHTESTRKALKDRLSWIGSP
jgi:hypothetical protein